MKNVIDYPITGIMDTSNPKTDVYTWIPYRMDNEGIRITKANEIPEEPNFIFITIDKSDEFDFAPELSIQDAAEFAKKFISHLSEDIIDIDLGSGL